MKAVDLNSIPYAHRFGGASLLVAKANRLSGLLGAQSQPVEPDALVAAVAYYKMALLLSKPFDPNYATAANWLCITLVALKQYEDATIWYWEIVRISDEVDGAAGRNATAALALDMLSKYSGLRNEPLPELRDGSDRFNDPPYCMYAEEFCTLLADRKFKKAYGYLAPSLQQAISLVKLKQEWLRITGDAHVEDIDIVLQQHMLQWPARKPNDIGWCHFSVSGRDFNEAATMVVARTPYNGYWITELEFGRP